MLPAEVVATAVDHAESGAARAGRVSAECADRLESVGGMLALPGGDAHGVWLGRSGARARVAIADAAAGVRALSGHCRFLADVLRVEGSRLVRAVVHASDDEQLAAGSGDLQAVIDADGELARRLVEASEALSGLVDAASRPCLDLSSTANEDPRVVADLWHSLHPADRQRLERDHPDLGSEDGVPALTRDVLNRARLRSLLQEGGDPEGGLRALADYLGDDPDRHLVDLSGDGRAVVASADPDRADRVVTLVPGTGSSLESIARTGERADAMCTAAGEQGGSAAEGRDSGADAGDRDRDCVAVAWQGYDAPGSIPEAGVSTTLATAGAQDLRTYAAGLDAVDRADGTDSAHAVVGYSYGSAVVGIAASDASGLAADRMLHVGSGGAGVDSLAEQRVDDDGAARPAAPEEVVGLASRWDPVPWWSITGVLGGRPGSAEFGGIGVDVTGPGEGPRSVGTAHSAYFDAGTVSLAEIGRHLFGKRGSG